MSLKRRFVRYVGGSIHGQGHWLGLNHQFLKSENHRESILNNQNWPQHLKRKFTIEKFYDQAVNRLYRHQDRKMDGH